MTVSEAAALFPSRADAEVLLAHALKRPRAWIFAHPEHVLSPVEEKAVQEAAVRRNAGEPVFYIIGKREFRGLSFAVDRHVLIPRPATESLVDLALEWWQEPFDVVRAVDSGIVAVGLSFGRRGPTRSIADIGTGSGCIAIALAVGLPQMRIVATDTSDTALNVAKNNAKYHAVTDRVTFLHGGYLEPIALEGEPFVVVSNPPYIPLGAEEVDNDTHVHEPHEALYAGENGTDVLAELVLQARTHPQCRGVLVECREDQVAALVNEEIDAV